MGYLKRLILVNSAGYPLADVRLDGHCDIAGGQGVGKTTLMNAILYPFVVEDRFIDIDRNEKERFSLYYFPSEMNSFVIYEVVNNLDVPYCILIHRSGAILYYHFISAPFDYDWLYEGEEQVKDWQEIRAKLNKLGITFKTEDRRERFNNIFLGKGAHYQEQYSIVRSNKDKDTIRPLLSAIFRNLPFSQETLKNALVAAVMSSNQLENEGIDLSSHRRNLEGFAERYSDIQKMTVEDKNGQTAIGPLAKTILDAVDKYYFYRGEMDRIPGRLAYAYQDAKNRIAVLEQSIKANAEAKAKSQEEWETSDKALQAKLLEVSSSLGGIRRELETIDEIEAKYKTKSVDIDTLVQWIAEKTTHVKELASLKKRRDALTSDSRDIQKQKEDALKENTLFYKNQEALERTRFSKQLEALQNKKDSVNNKAEKDASEVEKKYRSLLGEGWRETERQLIDSLVDLSGKLSAAETIDEVRAELDKAALNYGGILDGILASRNGNQIDIAALREVVAKERERLESELDRKIQLEKDKEKELSDISQQKKNALEAIKRESDKEEETHKKKNRKIFEECKEKEGEITADFDTKIHGNNEEIKAALRELNEFIAGEEEVLDAIEAFPSAAEDKARYFDKKDDLKKKREQLNLEINALEDQKKAAKTRYDEEQGLLNGKISTEEKEKENLTAGIQTANKFLDGRSDVKAALEDATPIENESTPSDIVTEYSDISDRISEQKECISKNVQRLYEPGMLSNLDTFQLGIGINDSRSRFEDFLRIAETLRTRLENSEEAMGMDKYIHLYSMSWLSEIKDIDQAMSPIENMLMQIGKLCHQATAFVKKNNTTDCIDSFSMSIDEEDAPDIIKLMRTISDFFKKNNTTLGFDNLFASDDGSVNRQAVDYLSQFAEILNRDTDLKLISLASMFNIRMDLVEKGNAIKNLLSFNNPGSRGTAIVLKAMLNMTLLHIVLEKHQAENTRLVCAIDEMNTIEARNLDALTDFASAAGLYIIGSGQHHTKSALDYSYNVWDERNADGKVQKFISMDAMETEPVSNEV